MLAQWKSCARRVLHAGDSPAKIAWGIAIGVLVAWTPTIGVQMIIAGSLAWLLRGNVAAAVAIVWISNPYTAIPIYYSNYLVGHYLVGGEWLDWSWFSELLSPGNRSHWEYLQYTYQKLGSIIGPMFVGSLVAGVPLAGLSFAAALLAVREHRRRHARQQLETPAPQSNSNAA